MGGGDKDLTFPPVQTLEQRETLRPRHLAVCLGGIQLLFVTGVLQDIEGIGMQTPNKSWVPGGMAPVYGVP